MPTPSLFPYLLHAEEGGGGPPVQTFTSEPIQLDIDTSNQVELDIIADAISLAMLDTPLTLDLADATITAQNAGTLDIDATPIDLELKITC